MPVEDALAMPVHGVRRYFGKCEGASDELAAKSFLSDIVETVKENCRI